MTPRGDPLNRERVLRAAVALADRDGLDALSMRKLGHELGIEAMSLYNHVRNKSDLLDAIVDLVLTDIDVPPSGTPWKEAMRRRSISAHEVLVAHPWAAMQIMSRFTIGPGMTKYLDATLGRLLEGGFTVEGALDAWHTLDSHLYGFTLQEVSLPFAIEAAPDVSAQVVSGLDPEQFPHVVRIISHVMQSGRVEDFEYGLDIVLDGLERKLSGT
ncbi:TetR family transcriptional regulator [Kribbella sandramycini]|uniref:AcrR family transcriptional regulator n=1 Tax=Kribbella sandramycini TaxID=60450 RepID=A0A7Y4NY78_9ACTN|nr:TetR/AcrR family transcriptional regulator C-terminal domain-containing protein [Kribbella sandramycini]MBB6567847.1 AcrR family transcriptional regulator [Kribbella sandramycini]NOL39558.1 TetR family transcriptional regulator [Kribbella sandramycini]